MSSAVQVTVVIPAYDRAHLLGRAIDSVLGQTLTPAAVIVVDDGSVDDTKAVVQAYGDEVRYVWQLNAGGAAARNHGVELAETEWVAFLDSDDLWLPNHLELLAEAVEGTAGAADITSATSSARSRRAAVRRFSWPGWSSRGHVCCEVTPSDGRWQSASRR